MQAVVQVKALRLVLGYIHLKLRMKLLQQADWTGSLPGGLLQGCLAIHLSRLLLAPPLHRLEHPQNSSLQLKQTNAHAQPGALAASAV